MTAEDLETKLSCMTKQELYALLQKANKRRKREVTKWKKESKYWYNEYVDKMEAYFSTCNNYNEYRRLIAQREQTMADHEAFYKEWKYRVDELAAKEGKRLAYVEHIKRCNQCEGRTWRKRYKMKVQGMQEYVTQMLKFINDVLRSPDIPDIEKARMVDMHNSLIDSRDFLAKELDDKTHLPDEWMGSKDS